MQNQREFTLLFFLAYDSDLNNNKRKQKIQPELLNILEPTIRNLLLVEI